MSLKKSNYRIQSSLANLLFVTYDLPLIWNDYNYNMLLSKHSLIVRNNKDFIERLEAIQLSALASHLEIIRSAFHDYIIHHEKNLKQDHFDYMNKIGLFLFHIRCALLHTNDELIPRADKKDIPAFKVSIPVTYYNNNPKFDPNGQSKYLFRWPKINKGKKINITAKKIHEIILLSYHILEITKKQKISTLVAYLNKI
jgi:hypothetical protein